MAFKVSHLRVYVGYLHQTLRRTRISKVGRLVASIFAHLGKALSFLPRGMGADGAGLLPIPSNIRKSINMLLRGIY